MDRKSKIVVVGLGYVGLPLAVALSRAYEVIGFDVDTARIKELERGEDRTKECRSQSLKSELVKIFG